MSSLPHFPRLPGGREEINGQGGKEGRRQGGKRERERGREEINKAEWRSEEGEELRWEGSRESKKKKKNNERKVHWKMPYCKGLNHRARMEWIESIAVKKLSESACSGANVMWCTVSVHTKRRFTVGEFYMWRMPNCSFRAVILLYIRRAGPVFRSMSFTILSGFRESMDSPSTSCGETRAEVWTAE